MKNTLRISERDYRLLSAYIDGELSQTRKEYIERLLEENIEAVEIVHNIKNLKTMLKHLPERVVPRNFTLTESSPRTFELPSFVGVLRYSSAVSALLLIIVLMLDFFRPFQTSLSLKSQENLPEQPAALELSPRGSDQPVPIIIWQGGYPSGVQGFGIGGWGDMGLGGMEIVPQMQSSTLPLQDDTMAEADSIQESPILEQEQLPQITESQPQLESEAVPSQEPKSSSAGGALILGIRPAEVQGSLIIRVKPEPVIVVESQTFPFRLVEFLLAGLAGVSIILALIIRRKKL